MVAGSRPQSGDALAISSKVRSTVKSIKEIVGDHSESDIYAVLKETNMDPDEAAQKLLNQDPFHEVRRRRDRKKENGSCNNGADDTTVQETKTEWKKPDMLWDRNGRAGRGGYSKAGRGGYSRPMPQGPVKEFRVVRDNRIKQKVDEDVTPAVGQTSDLCNSKVVLDNVDKSSKEEPITQNPSPLLTTSAAPVADIKKSAQINSNHVMSLPRKEHRAEICSSSDPIHVNVGLRRREVGVVGLRKPSDVYDSRNVTSVSNGNKSLTSENPRHVRPNSRSNHPPQPLASENGTRSAHVSQYNGKIFQQSASHQKAQQPNMEWRPKSSQSSKVSNSLTDQDQTEVAILSESLAKSNVSEDQHVIIPEHLRVPDSEKTSLVFGSFDAVKSSKETDNHSSSGDVLELPSETVKSDIEKAEKNEAQLRADSDLQILDEDTQNNSGPATESISRYESTLPHDLQENPSDIQSFQEYDPHSRYDLQFLTSVGGDSVGTQDITVMPTEAMISRPTSTSQILTHPVALQQQQNALQNQQHQQVPQMYQQMQLSAFPNYMPYRHVFPPVYVPPQMAVQNYANTPYPHPTQGNSYLLMPTSSPTQVAAGGLKYSTNQYKPVFTSNGYGNYTNPSNGYSVTPGVIGPVATFDDSSRVKFKDNNLYMPSQQVEASDIWVQNTRELLNMPSGAFYNVPVQPPTAAFLHGLNGSPSFNAAPQPPHVQYPSLHHTGQPASMALMPPGPHNMVHQQVLPSGLGPNMGVGVVAPPFQQNHQLGPIGWTANF